MVETSRRIFASRTAEGTTDLRILEDIPLAVTVHDASGELVYANDAAVRDLGIERPGRGSKAGPTFEVFDETGALLPPERLPGRLALTGAPTKDAVLKVRSVATGDERWAAVTAWPVIDDTGTIHFGVSVFTDITERHQSEETLLQRLAFQSDASETLASSLDYATIAAHVAKLAVPYLADWCIVYMIQRDGALRRLAMEHREPSLDELAKAIDEFVMNMSAPAGVPKVLRTGVSELQSDATPELLAADVFESEKLAELIRPLGITSWMCVPIAARGRILGAISFLSAGSGRRYRRRDLELAEDLGRRASTAVDNARLFEERSHIARTLQHSLLPPQLPDIPGIEIAARFRPTGEGNEVGGDFYDLFERAEGDWAVVIGDVCGKGADAAALTGLSRHTIRAAAMQERDPSIVLAMLNDAILLQDTGRFCTVCYVRLEPLGSRTTGHIGTDERFQAGMLGQLLRAQLVPATWVAPHARATISCGGHPLPYVVRREGPVEVVGTPGTLLGIYPDVELHDVEVTLGPGDSLVLYTDGVSEEPDPAGVDDTLLSRVLRDCIGMTATKTAERVELAALERQRGGPRDDIAILVVRMEP